jgi:Mg2+-importing ATPase
MCFVLAVPHIPKLNGALGMTAPEPEFYGFLAAIVVSYAFLVHAMKTAYQRLFKEWL